MKSQEFAKVLAAYADLIEEACGDGAMAVWRHMLQIFEIKPEKGVSNICKLIKPIAVDNLERGTTIAEAMHLAPAIKKCLETSATKQVIKDFECIIAGLEPFHAWSVEQFVTEATAHIQKPKPSTGIPSLSKAGILSYVHRLEEALGDDEGFRKVYSQLAKDRAVKADIAKEISRIFTKKAGKSKKDALGLIMRRHDNMMGARARSDATNNRTAA